MEDLTVEKILSLHHRIITERRGDSRVLSEANLHQLVFRANQIPTARERAAFIFWYCCAFPAFRAGNARTGCALAGMLLGSAGLRLTCQEREISALAADIAGCTADPGDVEVWFGAHTSRR